MAESDLFAEVTSEGATLDIDKAFERLETKGEKPSESQTEKTETVEPSQGGENTPEEKIPFHKHPRWQKTQQELKETKEKLERLEAERANSQTPAPPKWWTDKYGDTDEAKQSYSQVVQKDGELDWIKQSILSEIDQRTQAEQSQAKAADEYVDAQMAELKDEGLKFERNVLLKFMVDFQEEFGPGSLLDAEGNYDFRKGFALMQKMQPEETDESVDIKKGLASQAGRSKVSARAESKIPVVSTRALRKGGWREAGI